MEGPQLKKLVAVLAGADDLNRRRGGDVVARLQVARLADQVGEAVEFLPGDVLGEASAHGAEHKPAGSGSPNHLASRRFT